MSEQDIHEFDTEDAPDRERFEITNDEQAAWAMRKLLAFRKKMAENEAIADAERTRIDAWLNHVNDKFAPDIAYFEAILTRYAQHQRTNEDRKSIETPYGSVKSRSTQDKFKIVDEDEFFKWAEANLPQAIVVKRSPSLTELKKAATVEHTDTLGLVAMSQDGEIIPGVAGEPGGVNYTVEVSK
jgi:hypothetical protein